VDLDQAEEARSNDPSAVLTYFVSLEGKCVPALEVTAFGDADEDKVNDDSLGETVQPPCADSLLTPAFEGADAFSQTPLSQTQSGVQVYAEPGKSATHVQTDTTYLVPVDPQESTPHSESSPVAARGPPAGNEESVTDLHCSTYNGESQLREQTGENIGTNIGYTAPDLPGLKLIDPEPVNLAGQVIYLDFDGADDVVYNGPITVGPFDVPTFQAPGGLAGQEHPVILRTLAGLKEIFVGSGVIFAASRPLANQPRSTIYIGGDDSAFSQYGSFLGRA
jgi:hypothetical protein